MLRLFSRSSQVLHPVTLYDNNTIATDTYRKSFGASMDFFYHHLGKEKRHSLSGRSSPGGSRRASLKSGSPKLGSPKAMLEFEMESPPLVMHGSPEHSSGALLSAKLKLIVPDGHIQLAALEMRLIVKLTARKPVSKDCPDCISKITEIRSWTFLTEPTTYMAGTHSFPFSHLLPGSLPATSHGKLANIEYSLIAEGISDFCESVKLNQPLRVQRALAPSVERTSIRVFPPTNISATVTLPTAIYPLGDFNIQMRVTGVVESEGNQLRRWRIRKMNWRIDENSSMISPACAKHAHKISADGQEGKGILHQHTKSLGEKEYYAGWKNDFEEVGGGSIEMDFVAAFHSRPVCDVDSGTGFTVSHKLVIELVIGEDACSNAKSKNFVATGIARVLRMQLAILVTDRGGMGISWDEEQPPMYENVPSSPPGYTTMDDYNGEPLPYEDLERLAH